MTVQCDRFTELFTCGSSAHIHSESGDLYSVTLKCAFIHFVPSDLCRFTELFTCVYLWFKCTLIF